MKAIRSFIGPVVPTSLALVSFVASTLAQEVSIPDPELNAAIRATLKEPVGPLTEEDLLLSPIVSSGIKWKAWQSRCAWHLRDERIMNPADQFEAIVCEHYEPLYRFAMSLTRVESDARDLTQQTFYVWATKGHQLRDIGKVKAWLYTTMHRAFLAARRRQIRFPHHDVDQVSDQLPMVAPVVADRLDSSDVLAALARVDEVYQAAVALFYLEDCSYKDIATILELPIGTVKSRIARGILQLRNMLLSTDSHSSTQRNVVQRTGTRVPPTAGNTLAPYDSYSVNCRG